MNGICYTQIVGSLSHIIANLGSGLTTKKRNPSNDNHPLPEILDWTWGFLKDVLLHSKRNFAAAQCPNNNGIQSTRKKQTFFDMRSTLRPDAFPFFSFSSLILLSCPSE
jgi:hypothetical protein